MNTSRSALCLDYQSVYCQKQEKVSTWSLTLAASLLLLLALSFKIWIGIAGTSLGYELAEERERTVAYDMERRDCELQLSILLRPDNLTRRAREQLGLGVLDPKQARRMTY